jgi:hypothetical protein
MTLAGFSMQRPMIEDHERRIAPLTHREIKQAVRRSLVDEAPAVVINQHHPARYERFQHSVEPRVEQPKSTIMANELGVDLGRQVDGIATRAVRADVPGPPRCGRRREELLELLVARSETAAGKHHRVSSDLVPAHRNAAHFTVLHEKTINPLPQSNIDSAFSAFAVQHVDDSLPLTDGNMSTRRDLVEAHL